MREKLKYLFVISLMVVVVVVVIGGGCVFWSPNKARANNLRAAAFHRLY
jgi:hypothetical protein